MKIISNTLYGLFVLMLLGVAGLFLASLLPIPGNIEMKIVKSGSMEPTIHTGSVVVVKPSASYDVGDVITFGEDTAQQIPTTHRIVSIHGDFANLFYTTKGDANEEQDPQQVGSSSVIGKVVLSVPYAGYILDFARQPMGFTLMIGIPAAIIIMDELFKIFGEVRRIRKPKRGKTEQEMREDEGMDEVLAEAGVDVGVRVAREDTPFAGKRAVASGRVRNIFAAEQYDYSGVRMRNIDGITPRGYEHV